MVIRLLLLPLQAPMLVLLVAVCTFLGLHWSLPEGPGGPVQPTLYWLVECAQALIVVVICTIPDLLLQRLSLVMASSRVLSLVVTLLLVIIGGLYLIHLEVLASVLILGASVLLTRLDLLRLRLVPSPAVMTLVLAVMVLAGLSLGRWLTLPVSHLEIYPARTGEHGQPALQPALPAPSRQEGA
ncbi:MAG: hypothetical protein VKM01_08865 [Cyanobacteriota bacterium]|nr:hypothetical protein [Cyanobacteriota bacterium]